MAERRAFIREEETRLAAISETAEEVRSLRKEVRNLRTAAARCELLERDRIEAATLTRQLERHLQAKSREVARLSSALQQAFVTAKARSYQGLPGHNARGGGGGGGGGGSGGSGLIASGSRGSLGAGSVSSVGSGWRSASSGVEIAVISSHQHRLQKRAKAAQAAQAAAEADAVTEGYELCQVLAEPTPLPPPPAYYAHASAPGEADPLALLDRQQSRAAVPANPHTVIRMRGKVYKLTELKRDAPQGAGLMPPEEIGERLAAFRRHVALDAPETWAEGAGGGAGGSDQRMSDSQHRYAHVQQQAVRKTTTGPVPVTVSTPIPPAAAPPVGPPRPAPHLRPHSAGVARGRSGGAGGGAAGGAVGASAQDAPYVYHPPSSSGAKPPRPSSAQARLRTGPAGHRAAPQPGGDPHVDGVSRMVLAGALQQGHTKRWERYLEPGMLGY